jgi:transcriptional regulator with XRE-family HTH domain
MKAITRLLQRPEEIGALNVVHFIGGLQMSKNADWSEVPVGRYVAEVRDEAGMTQANLAGRVTLSTATLSRIESGEKTATEDEVSSLLKAIGTPKAKGLAEYLKQDWDQIDRPAFDHPDRTVLWEANLTLRKLDHLRADPDVKAVFLRQMDFYEKEIQRLSNLLRNRAHQIAFIGGIGVGKSTAICKLVNLLKTTETKLDRQIVLETGAGGITICEVHISHGPKYGLRIVPRSENSIRKDVEDLSDYLFRMARPDAQQVADGEPDDEEGDPLGISKEVARAIRNMSGLTEKRKEENGKRIRIDPAKELAQQCSTPLELAIQILTRMDLLRRSRRDAWYPDDCPHPPTHWLQQMFLEVNNGRQKEFTLPQKIEVVVPYPVFDSRDLPIRIIDTKGIDQTAERQDLECHFNDQRTLVVLCSRFNDAPEVAIQNLLNRAKESGVRDLAMRTTLLVLPRPDEAMAVKHDDGARVDDDLEGYDLKRDQVLLRLNQKGMGDLTVEFFNARDDATDGLRERLIGKIVAQRQFFAGELEKLGKAVESLIANRENEQVRLAFEEVSTHLHTWTESNRTLSATDEGVQTPLISAIDATRYASTVRAAVRRYGDWDNLDYYHHLSYGVRLLAVEQIGKRIEELQVIVTNLKNNEELAPTIQFLERALSSLDAAVDESYKRIQTAGRETFKQTLEQDIEFWGRCERRWGQGQGYRHAISEMTDERFVENYKEAHRLVLGLINEEWRNLIGLLEGMLSKADQVSAA